MKIYKNNKLIWNSETRAEHTAGDAFTWLSLHLANHIEKIEQMLPACNYNRDIIQSTKDMYQVKIVA